MTKRMIPVEQGSKIEKPKLFMVNGQLTSCQLTEARSLNP